jgi:hypothetical protein
LIATALTASSANVDAWVPVTLGVTSTGLILGLLGDLLRRRR